MRERVRVWGCEGDRVCKWKAEDVKERESVC